jgi:hypothetical protein
MPRPILPHDEPAPAFVPGEAPKRYLVARRNELWFITFDGDEYGPYQSEREAMLFAIDAAQKLGDQGQATQVQRVDEDGETQPAWTYSKDGYPPRL